MPTITRIVETALYADRLEVSAAFYRDVLGLRVLDASPRLVSLDGGGGTVLLLFQRGASVSGVETTGGWIPAHDASGPQHVAFGIERETLVSWEQRLARVGVEIESRVAWPRGGHSLYVRDP